MKRIIPIAVIIVIPFLLLASTRQIVKEPERIEPEPEKSIYEICVDGTSIPPDLLRAIARVESDEMDNAVGDGGMSLGRFQLNEKYHSMRSRAYGEYSPHDPIQAGHIAAHYLEECFRAYPGDEVKAICSYRQGIYGVKRNGATRWYYDRVMARL